MRGIASFLAAVFISIQVFAQAPLKGDELYAQRIASIKSQLDLTYNAEVKKYIDQYLENPEKTKEILSLGKIYFPQIEKALKAKNVPSDLKYLAVAVSDLNALASNTYGASGQWMMMYTVSKMYKLKVNSFIDERNDPVKSSVAAATHFKDLYSIYKQWPLAIAAYGCSPVMLNKCIRMANNSLYFWDVYPYIPENSKGLYPKVIATVYIFNYYKEHGLKLPAPTTTVENDSVLVNKWLSFQQISATLDIPLEQLRKMNPVFKKDVIPYNPEGYWIYLPKTKGKQFDLLKDSVYSPLPKMQEFTPVSIQKAPTDTSAAAPHINESKETTNPQVRVKKAKVLYTVKKGDNLGDIADWFDADITDVRKWNKIKGNKINSGKQLQLFVDKTKTGYYKRINKMTAAQKKKLKNKD